MTNAPTPPTEYDLAVARQRVEQKLAAAQASERERIERETAARREIETAQNELARLTRLQLAAAHERTVEDAHAGSAQAHEHTDELKRAADTLITALVEFANGPLSTCERDVERVQRLNDTAHAAALDVVAAAPPPPDKGETDFDREFAATRRRDTAILKGYERLPAPILPWAVLLDMRHTETDDLRRRALGALFFLATGQEPPRTGEAYTAELESRRIERNRIRRYTSYDTRM